MAIVTGMGTMPVARGGKVVRVMLGGKRGMMMYESEAREKGYLPPLPEEKARAPARNKARKAEGNK